ncbi:MAG: phage holin family protein [Bacteroidales bacterium]|nr:phage holin family protein [Bacteroidales bacterium]
MEKTKSSYPWRYTKIGGVTRVNIETGDDIAHLPELDQKQWTVLSCPTTGLEIDPDTLKMLDTDGDGHIKVNEVIAAIEWLKKVLKNMDSLTEKSAVLPLSVIRNDTDEGKKIINSAQDIISNLHQDKTELAVDETNDSVKIFANTKFNGDGIITEATAEADDLKKIIATIIANIGKATDRSGVDGVTKELIEEFYTEATDFTTWKNLSLSDSNLIPYGDKTAAARDAYYAIKDKVADYFIRCKFVAMDQSTSAALEISKDSLAKIAEKNLSESIAEIETYPLTNITATAQLPLNEPINPAWEGKFNALKSLVLDAEFAGKTSISEAEWNTIGAKFDAYDKWLASKKGTKVEGVDFAYLTEVLASSKKDELLALVAKDLEQKDNAESIQDVNKLAHLYRDMYTFLRNFVTFTDFYNQYKDDTKAIFQAGTLFIDQRSCDLCIKVADMGKHTASAAQSAMFIAYCDCESKKLGKKMQIAAVITDGDVDNITAGKNGVFYDRAGNDWEATVTKVIDNPISIRQAFWSPYKKFAKFIEEQVTKFASTKDAEATKNATAKISEKGAEMTAKPAEGAAAAAPKQPFDIAKFCGIFAAIGLALGFIGSFIVSAVTGFLNLPWWGMFLAVLAIMLLISGPAMLLAYLKLRRRNLAPVLNANGWAVNAHAFVNITFGATLTQLAKFPFVKGNDPLADKKYPLWKKILWIIVVVGIIGFALYCNGKLERFGLTPPEALDFRDKPQTEAPAAATPDASAADAKAAK